MTLKEFAKELNGKGAEGKLIKSVLYSLLTSFVLLALLYYIKLRYVENFLPKYGFYLFFGVLSYSIIIAAASHVRAYKQFACMSGMMIGMTFGMIAGFMPGYLIGATNGMFYGSVFGMAVGIAFGYWNGRCCGIMGIMEGVMAGFMGGLMGAMTSVMMINDNLKAATVIVFVVCSVIMVSLSYMIYKETREVGKYSDEGQLFTLIMSLILTAITVGFMVFGPRSLLFQ